MILRKHLNLIASLFRLCELECLVSMFKQLTMRILINSIKKSLDLVNSTQIIRKGRRCYESNTSKNHNGIY